MGHGLYRLDDVVLLVAHRAQGQTAGELHGVPGGGIVPHLAGDDEHGDRVQPAAHHAGECIGAAGPGGDADRRDAVVQPGIGLRRNGAGLLVVVVGDVQGRVVAKRIVQVHGAAAHHREHVGDAVGGKKVGDVVGETLGHGRSS